MIKSHFRMHMLIWRRSMEVHNAQLVYLNRWGWRMTTKTMLTARFVIRPANYFQLEICDMIRIYLRSIQIGWQHKKNILWGNLLLLKCVPLLSHAFVSRRRKLNLKNLHNLKRESLLQFLFHENNDSEKNITKGSGCCKTVINFKYHFNFFEL